MTTFSTAAMLVSLNVRCYSARREDKKISADVAAQHNTTADAGKYAKQLVPKLTLEPITKAITAMRDFHYSNTLPWLDEGIRILPSANFETYRANMVSLEDAYDSAVRTFVANWPATIEDARVRLNGMFNAADYPTDIQGRFGCALRFMPIPDAADFRVDISDLERETLRAQIADTLGEAQQAAMNDLWSRVALTVSTMAERLAAYKVDPQTGKVLSTFRDSLVENLRELCGLIPRLNFTGDARLESIRQEIETALLTDSAAELRENSDARDKTQARAEEIARKISEFMV